MERRLGRNCAAWSGACRMAGVVLLFLLDLPILSIETWYISSLVVSGPPMTASVRLGGHSGEPFLASSRGFLTYREPIATAFLLNAGNTNPPHLHTLKAIIDRPAIDRLMNKKDSRDRSGCYAIVHISGNPRWMEKGRYYDVYRIHQRVGRRVHLLRLQFYQSPTGWYINGEPYIHNIRAVARIIKHFRSPKMTTVKFRSKKHYKRTIGHRQEMTRILIEDFEVFNGPEDGADDSKNEKMENVSGPSRHFSALNMDPINFALMKMQYIKTPSLELPKMKRCTIYKMTEEQKALLGSNPLEHFDPVYNQLAIREQILSHF
ncbi:ribosomal protein L21family member protein [Theileria equi strain WA]|uniref:Ribosomal protein L21family member protein n=1 Tax=Theileria equi strain WA TaxID=1537102 RepID=L1LB40_THEEQ|nr:ribosomal protein L21family member protein [Theileria equi strain WA]EKX72546.1 ribosomal protein L21family member protein [Theileria equi strain WA]|eukprot:XP_004831998.1 ribosomal protein L21family member protein [Theileria equi strain WA]